MPVWQVHFSYILVVLVAFIIGGFLPDLDHYKNECNLLQQTCYGNSSREGLFLHNFKIPLAILALGVAWFGHLVLDYLCLQGWL